MLVNIRGTNGSGKTTAVRLFLDMIGGMKSLFPHYITKRKFPLYYTHNTYPIALIGHYEAACGGVDTLDDYDQLVKLLLRLHSQNLHCLFEGVLISGDTKQMYLLRSQIPDIRVIYLTTPYEVCVERISKRRQEKCLASGKSLSDLKPLNTKNTRSKYDLCISTRLKLEATGQFRCRRAPVEQAAELCYEWLTSSVHQVNNPALCAQASSDDHLGES